MKSIIVILTSLFVSLSAFAMNLSVTADADACISGKEKMSITASFTHGDSEQVFGYEATCGELLHEKFVILSTNGSESECSISADMCSGTLPMSQKISVYCKNGLIADLAYSCPEE